jgi:xanthine dehydrogenase YagR molybdenum-binding subunit
MAALDDLFEHFLIAAGPEHADPVFVAAAETDAHAPGAPDPKKHVGAAMDRVDGRLKVTGGARYAAEFSAPRLARAVLLQSTVASGRISNLDTAEAERALGVIAIITYRNLPAMPRPSVPPAGESLPLLTPEIHYSGQNVAVVVAETFEQADHAASLIRVEYAGQKPTVSLEDHLRDAFVPNTGNRPPTSKRGDFAGAATSAPLKVEHIYRTPIEHHNPMEPHGTVAVWSGDTLTVYDATQGVGNTAQNLAEQFGLLPEDVHVIDPFVGGGFGCKGQSWAHTPLAALAAKVTGRPVRLSLSRRQMFSSNGHRPQTRQANVLAASRDGKLVALQHQAHNHTSRNDEFVEPTGGPAALLYSCPNVDVTQRLVRLNTGSPTYMRAPGESSGSFGLETAMDELAVAAAIDPIELRLRNYAEIDESTGHPWSSKSLRQCYTRGAELFGWSRRDARPGSMREGQGRWLIGMGMATAAYPANFRPASAKALMYADGRVEIRCGTQDLGTGTYTILTQIAADELKVDPSKVRVMLGDSHLPGAPTSGGSCSATSAGSAVQAAARALRTRITQNATSDESSPLWNAKASDIDGSDGRLFLKKDPSKSVSYTEIFARYNKRVIEQEAGAKPGIERAEAGEGGSEGAGKKEPGTAHTMHGFGAQFCEVRVDRDLGTIRVARWVGVFALGKQLNIKTLRSQLHGGIVWGIGMTLLEESLMDARHGRFVNSNLAEYHVPVNADVPRIEVALIDEEDALVSPLGAKGAGEIGITGAAAAIGNAVFHATGRRVRDLPITLDKLL